MSVDCGPVIVHNGQYYDVVSRQGVYTVRAKLGGDLYGVVGDPYESVEEACKVCDDLDQNMFKLRARKTGKEFMDGSLLEKREQLARDILIASVRRCWAVDDIEERVSGAIGLADEFLKQISDTKEGVEYGKKVG